MSDVLHQDFSLEKCEGVELFARRKGPADARSARGNVVLVHGSSQASLPCFDLIVGGSTEYSLMESLAAQGWNAWTFDCEGYGKSSKHRERLFDIADGADDLEVVMKFINEMTGDDRIHVYGGSSGALRAAVYVARDPALVGRLALDALVWTGEGSPTLEQRRKRLPELTTSLRRPIDRASLTTIFNRDHPGSADEVVIEAFADAVLELDDSIPNGTYIDMCTKLPVVDPAAIKVPVMIVRGEWDGIAAEEDVLAFFTRLPNPDKQLIILPGVAHAALNGKNHALATHTLLCYFSRPEPVYLG